MRKNQFEISYFYFIILTFIFYSCSKTNESPNSLLNQGVINIHDHYKNDSIIIEYPNGRTIAVKRDSSLYKTNTFSNLRTESGYGQDYTTGDEMIDPMVYEDNVDPKYVNEINNRSFKFFYSAGMETFDGLIISFVNVFVRLENNTIYYNDNGRNVQRSASVYDTKWYCTPLLPARSTAFTWDYIVNATYYYGRDKPSVTRQYHYDKTVVF